MHLLLWTTLALAQPEAPMAAKAAAWQTACDAGEASACVELGAVVAAGVLAEADAERARGYFERACVAEEASGCRELGMLLSRGPTNLRDPSGALEAWDQACSLGERSACQQVQRERPPTWEGAAAVASARQTLEALTNR